jgi:thioredoxin 1
MASENLITLGDDSFQKEVLESDVPVLVDFWAVWCGPCRAVAPVVERLAGEYKGRLKVGKFNVDDHPGVPAKYGVMSIPTLLLFKNGKVADQIIGNRPRDIESMVQRSLA